MFLLTPLPEQSLLRVPAGRCGAGAEARALGPVVLALLLEGLARAICGAAATGVAGLVGVGEGGCGLGRRQDNLQQ